jgi:hypothetical protein
MLSSKTGLSLNMAGHYPGGSKRSGNVGAQPGRPAGWVYPNVRYLGPAYAARSAQAIDR